MSATNSARRTRDKVRWFFFVAVSLWLLGIVGWAWVYWQMRAAAQDDATCAVQVDGDSYTEFVGRAEWQSSPQPGILCRYAVQMRGRDVEIIELRPVSLSSAGLLVLWGATLLVLRPRADGRSRAP